jgi:hypothetical protein
LPVWYQATHSLAEPGSDHQLAVALDDQRVLLIPASRRNAAGPGFPLSAGLSRIG